jgi:hypothetical protein
VGATGPDADADADADADTAGVGRDGLEQLVKERAPHSR